MVLKHRTENSCTWIVFKNRLFNKRFFFVEGCTVAGMDQVLGHNKTLRIFSPRALRSISVKIVFVLVTLLVTYEKELWLFNQSFSPQKFEIYYFYIYCMYSWCTVQQNAQRLCLPPWSYLSEQILHIFKYFLRVQLHDVNKVSNWNHFNCIVHIALKGTI